MSEPDEFELTDSEGRPGVASLPLWSEDFVQQETARLYRIVASPWLRPDQVEDIIQDVLLEAYQQRSRFLGEDAAEHLRRWLSRVARSKRADFLRQLRRHPVLSLDDLPMEPVAHEEDESADRQEQEREHELFHLWLEEVSETDQLNYRLLYARYVEGRTVVALAAQMSLTVRAAYCRLGRQVQKFAAWAEPHRHPDSDK